MLLMVLLEGGVVSAPQALDGIQRLHTMRVKNGVAKIESFEFHAVPVRDHFKEYLSSVPATPVQGRRTPAKHVGAVMAILATFEQARVLPPESTPKANQLIRALIQFQSAFMNQESRAVQEYVSDALTTQLGQSGPGAYRELTANGWTSKAMEALVDYSRQHPFWSRPGMPDALSRYNVSSDDWDIVVEMFNRTRDQFRTTGQDLHEIFAVQRRNMPGGKP